MKRFLPYFSLLKPVRWAFVWAIASGMIFGVASGFGIPFVAQKVLPILFGDHPVPSGELVLYLSILPLAFAIRGISGFFNTYLISYCGTTVLNELRSRVFSKLQQMPLLTYQKHPTGDLLTRATNDTSQLQNTLLGVSNDLIKYPITFVSALSAVVYLAVVNHQILFVVILLSVIPVCIIPIRSFGIHLQNRAMQSQAQTATVTDILNENIRGAREVKLYSQENYQLGRFRKAIGDLQRYTLKIVKYQAGLSPILEFVSALGITVAIYYAFRVHLGLNTVLPLIAAIYMAYEPMRRIGGVHNSLKQGQASLMRIEQLPNEPLEVQDPASSVRIDKIKGAIEFKNVGFSYPHAERPALREFSLSISPGETVGVVGPSGAGKSTLLNLLPRLFDPSAGTVTIDGIDIMQLRCADLRAHISAVPQEAFLFNDTVAANIALSDEAGGMERIVAAAKRARAHEFIMTLPKGYDTKVGEAGGQLSGGQRQRVAIARAFYKDAPILIMDEPTSALDSENENEIFTSLKDLASGRTSLIVSHRLKSLYFCHRIAYMEEGRLIAFGTHDELMRSCEGYQRLYQFGGEAAAYKSIV
jgi:subfamily B ATP-binding cassette protein MsbA